MIITKFYVTCSFSQFEEWHSLEIKMSFLSKNMLEHNQTRAHSMHLQEDSIRIYQQSRLGHGAKKDQRQTCLAGAVLCHTHCAYGTFVKLCDIRY